MFDDSNGTLLDLKKNVRELKLECKGRFDTCTRGIFIFVIARKNWLKMHKQQQQQHKQKNNNKQ
jgi:hypothetical protein